MKNLFGVLLVSLSALAPVAGAAVTPAYASMNLVKAFLDSEVEAQLPGVFPQRKPANYLIQFQSNLMRGKYSEAPDGFTDFFGTTEVMVQSGVGGPTYEASCNLSATAQVVPYAMQPYPILETEPNNQQLVLKRHQVHCRLR